MARKTKDEAERTYHALLNAATALFIKQGIAKTTLNDIATAAGMTRGAVYWHFDNKDAVIRALWDRNAGTLHARFNQELLNLDPENPEQHFRQAIKSIVQNIVSEPELGEAIHIVMHCVEFTDEQTELQRYLRDKRSELHNALEKALTVLQKRKALHTSLSPALLAQGMICYLYGLIHNHLEPGKAVLDLRKNGDALLDLFMDSLFV
ncbi:MAG: hypothetical protein C0631_14140 [Sedimenticola sp.]|nr:MAG: hypothetical protein C0631_14140 [Sedimenticola sp.]